MLSLALYVIHKPKAVSLLRIQFLRIFNVKLNNAFQMLHQKLLVVRLHQLVMFDVMRELLSRSSSMTPGLDSDLFANLLGETSRPVAARVMLDHIFDRIRMYVIGTVTHVI